MRRARDGRRSQKAPRTAFVLAGGGTRGAVQVGMLAELVSRGIVPDRLYGASVGAVNGAAFCGDPTPEGMARLEAVWRNLRSDDVFPRSRVHGPWTLLAQRESMHPNTGLRKVIEDGLRFERLEDAEIPLEVVATSLSDGSERWFDQGPAVDAILASAAIPGIFPPVEIGGEQFVDGGVVNNVPISRAIAGGAERIFVLLCGPARYRPRPAKRPLESVVNAFFLTIHARFARDLETVPPNVEVTILSGGARPPFDYRDFGATHAMVERGRAVVRAVLDGAQPDSAQAAGGIAL